MKNGMTITKEHFIEGMQNKLHHRNLTYGRKERLISSKDVEPTSKQLAKIEIEHCKIVQHS